MIKATEANKLVSNIDKVLLGLGTTNGTKLPTSKSNSGDIALQYWLWSRVSSFVKKKMDKAAKDATKAGVIFDPKEEPMPPGEERQVYSSDMVNVIVKTSQPSTRLDAGMLKHHLRVAKVKDTIIDAAFEAATVTNNAPHRFTATLNEVDD